MEIHIDVHCVDTHIEGSVYGASYRRCNVWRLIQREQCIENFIEGTMCRDSYKGYNIWRLILTYNVLSFI